MLHKNYFLLKGVCSLFRFLPATSADDLWLIAETSAHTTKGYTVSNHDVLPKVFHNVLTFYRLLLVVFRVASPESLSFTYANMGNCGPTKLCTQIWNKSYWIGGKYACPWILHTFDAREVCRLTVMQCCQYPYNSLTNQNIAFIHMLLNNFSEFLYSKKFSLQLLNLSPSKSVWSLISPYILTLESKVMVKRIKEMINN